MSFFAEKNAIHVVLSYGSAALILGGLVIASIAANARARRALEEAEKERRK